MFKIIESYDLIWTISSSVYMYFVFMLQIGLIVLKSKIRIVFSTIVDRLNVISVDRFITLRNFTIGSILMQSNARRNMRFQNRTQFFHDQKLTALFSLLIIAKF